MPTVALTHILVYGNSRNNAMLELTGVSFLGVGCPCFIWIREKVNQKICACYAGTWLRSSIVDFLGGKTIDEVLAEIGGKDKEQVPESTSTIDVQKAGTALRSVFLTHHKSVNIGKRITNSSLYLHCYS